MKIKNTIIQEYNIKCHKKINIPIFCKSRVVFIKPTIDKHTASGFNTDVRNPCCDARFNYMDARPSLFQNIVSTNEDVIIIMWGRLEENSGLALSMILKVYYNIENKWKLPRVSEPRKSQVPFFIFICSLQIQQIGRMLTNRTRCWSQIHERENSIIYEREFNKFPKSMNSPEGSRYE